jgi:hypothetical protein
VYVYAFKDAQKSQEQKEYVLRVFAVLLWTIFARGELGRPSDVL